MKLLPFSETRAVVLASTPVGQRALCSGTPSLPRVAIANCHKEGGLEDRIAFSHSSEGQSPKPRVSRIPSGGSE